MTDLITADHRDALRTVLSAPTVTTAVREAVRRKLGHHDASRVLAVAELQKKAVDKLGPGRWWVTARSLQQATAWQVAKQKAEWFGDALVHDLCCGIGGDLTWLARRGRVLGVDADPEIAAMASANRLESAVENSAEVVTNDVLEFAGVRLRAIHVDPDRRVGGRRATAADRFQPSWEMLLPMLGRADAAVAKLAPATRFQEHELPTVHRCWISLRGSVREQAVLFGDAIHRAGVAGVPRSALAITSNGSWQRFVAGNSDGPAQEHVGQPGPWLVDPDAAVRAAGLTDAFAVQHGLRTLGGPAGFLCGETVTEAGKLASAGRVIWSGTVDDRKLRKELRRLDSHPAAIKVRGLDHNPQTLLARYRRCGEMPVTLWMGRTNRGAYAAMTTPSP